MAGRSRPDHSSAADPRPRRHRPPPLPRTAASRALLREEGAAPLRLGRQALAELVGSTQFSVSRLLSAWERGGVVETGRQWVRVRVRDVGALRALAEG